ncbi:MAG: hypothetical protein JWR21_2910 [Herminiimonas sp.]|nr:hypothetical protein [Herminiimonas sp.]MDB5854023.1 hypothetical protein [Herminiimonas sp.]
MFHVDVEYREGDPEGSDPVSFSIGSRRVAVDEIVDRWPAEDHGYVKLIGDDTGIYILRFDRESAGWEMTFFDSRRGP